MRRYLLLILLAFFQTLSQAQGLASNEEPKPSPVSIKLREAIVEATRAPDKIILFALDPGTGTPPGREETGFHGWPILGKRTIFRPLDQPELLRALANEVIPTGLVNLCGCAPHHGVRIQRGNHRLDLVICYSCWNIEGYIDGKRTGLVPNTGFSEDQLNACFTSLGLPTPKSKRR